MLAINRERNFRLIHVLKVQGESCRSIVIYSNHIPALLGYLTAATIVVTRQQRRGSSVFNLSIQWILESGYYSLGVLHEKIAWVSHYHLLLLMGSI